MKMLENLEALLTRWVTRRAFFVGTGAFALTSLEPSLVAGKTQNSFPTRSAIYDISSLEPVTIEETPPPQLTIDEYKDIQEALNQFLQKNPALKILSAEPEIALKARWIKLEPDMQFAQGLARKATESIDDIFNFLNTPYIVNPGITPIVPRRSSDIRFDGYGKIPLYLVAAFGNSVVAAFKVNLFGKTQYLHIERSYDKGIVGESERPGGINVTKEGRAKFWQRLRYPIFYNTSADLVSRIETPAIEALHNEVGYHTHNLTAGALNEGGRRPNFDINDIKDMVRKHTLREEKFVHALSILWLEQYNNRRKYATPQDLKKRFDLYEREGSIYQGANKLAEHIRGIGVQRAIELYVNNPDRLFVNAGIKI